MYVWPCISFMSNIAYIVSIYSLRSWPLFYLIATLSLRDVIFLANSRFLIIHMFWWPQYVSELIMTLRLSPSSLKIIMRPVHIKGPAKVNIQFCQKVHGPKEHENSIFHPIHTNTAHWQRLIIDAWKKITYLRQNSFS